MYVQLLNEVSTELDAYSHPATIQTSLPLLDFIFAVNHPSHWHSINIHQYPSHYPLHARLLGSSFIAKFQHVEPGIWFNAYVPMHGVVSILFPGI